VVQLLGVPLTEVGHLVVHGAAVTPGYRPAGGDVVQVAAMTRPQPVPTARFILDVHLGALARRLRLAGVDAAYANNPDDDALIEQANAERRILLTQDRGLLRRRTLWLGAHVRGAHPDTQLADVLGRFAPPLAPGPGAPPATAHSGQPPRPKWSRCCSPAPGAPGVLPLPNVQARVLARREQQTAPGPHLISAARRPHHQPDPGQLARKAANDDRCGVRLPALYLPYLRWAREPAIIWFHPNRGVKLPGG